MAVVTGPLLSVSAGGQVGKTQVYSTWRGIPYVRRYTQPSNPKTTGQTSTRSVFAWLSSVWKVAPSFLTDPWNAFATGQPFLGRNAFIGKNTKVLRPGVDLSEFIGSPGSKGGPPPSGMTATGGTGHVVVAVAQPTPPSGWTLSGASVAMLRQQDPHSGTTFVVSGGTLVTPFTGGTLTVPAVGTYEVSAWSKWSKSDGSVAYSPSINAVAITT